MEVSIMVAVKEITWEEASAPDFENPARHAWREAVAEVADKAKATLPECNGRVEKAAAIVLNDDVELLADGKARVASQSNGQTVYHIANGECDCKDYPKAPSHWCRHRIARRLHLRATALAKHKLAPLDGASNGQTTPASHDAPAGEAQVWRSNTTPTPPPPLPEAPASCNVYVTLAGRKVQVTLRDSDEQRLLARLDALLQRFPAAAEPEDEQEPPEGWCRKHGVQMKLRNGEHGSWWSHKTADSWCKGQ
jgi:hypothetical protein